MKIKRTLIVILSTLLVLQSYGLIASENPGWSDQSDTVGKESAGQIEDEPRATDDSPDTPFFRSVGRDLGTVITSPLHVKKRHVWKWLGVAAITGVLIATDESTYRDIKRFQEKNKWVDDVSPKITKLGLGEWNLGIAGAFYVGGLIFKDKKARETARLTVMTFIHTGVVVQLGKHLCGRQRPSWENGHDGWAGPEGFFKRYKSGQLAHYDAFPSGHMISITGTATVVAEMYKDTVWVPILSYSLAAACGLSRITEDTHWLSDVFLGAVLGYVIGKYVVKKRNRLGLEQNKLTVLPVANGNYVGIGIHYTF